MILNTVRLDGHPIKLAHPAVSLEQRNGQDMIIIKLAGTKFEFGVPVDSFIDEYLLAWMANNAEISAVIDDMAKNIQNVYDEQNNVLAEAGFEEQNKENIENDD